MTNDFISNMMENLAGRRFYLFWVRLRPEGAQGPQHGKNPSSNTRKFPFLENMSRNFSETLGELSCSIQKVRARVVERICKLTPPLGPFPIGLLPSGFTLLWAFQLTSLHHNSNQLTDTKMFTTLRYVKDTALVPEREGHVLAHLACKACRSRKVSPVSATCKVHCPFSITEAWFEWCLIWWFAVEMHRRK
jgi:hypothetical protein